ncbi:hypothetical protein [Streptomyces iconiensis]|uniref:Uncharacterized protein n=1 Tax=Streptomyces iconiensis TaxID=1384038 RepID=A0ABT6ZRS7_9ACTN|nr:hypothetical protein [Streptomyces iconiensis]MDJ1131766.1 hypothetical protein [Streptomyces iconiensis]
MKPERSNLVAGPADTITAIATNYRCGHCNSETELHDDGGMPSIRIHHDDQCPVLTGTLSALPDTLRAMVPDTFRPAR